MNAKGVFFGFLTATLALTSLTTLKPASAVEQFNHQTIQSAHTKANLIARGRPAGVVPGPAMPRVRPSAVPGKFNIQQKVIDELVERSKNSEEFVKGLMEEANHKAGEKMNVMVFNMTQPYDFQSNARDSFQTVPYNKVNYRIWIFEDGTFTNKGDGGYINWAFSGKFKRSGDQGHTVTFEKR